jgi:peptidoglycan/LPS O-acetylase OafA/YrhL
MTPRNHQLDLLRGIAILLVLGHHYVYFKYWTQFGWVGVDLFFVLSGFLISGLLFKEWARHRHINVKRFLIRRGFKIYPGFYVLLMLTWIVLPADPDRPSFLVDAFFLQGYFTPVWEHGWSLAVEEHFYLLLPVLLLLLARRKGDDPFSPLPLLSAALFGLCLVMRISTAADAENFDRLLRPTHLRIDTLLGGVTLGYFYHFHRDRFLAASTWKTLVCGLLLLVPSLLVPMESPFITTVGYTFNALGFMCILIWSMNRSFLKASIIERIGVYSYSIYLWHQAVHLVADRFFPVHTFWMLCVYVLACILFGALMAHVVEFPLLTIRDRWFPAVRRPDQPAEGTDKLTIARDTAIGN